DSQDDRGDDRARREERAEAGAARAEAAAGGGLRGGAGIGARQFDGAHDDDSSALGVPDLDPPLVSSNEYEASPERGFWSGLYSLDEDRGALPAPEAPEPPAPEVSVACAVVPARCLRAAFPTRPRWRRRGSMIG